MGLVGQATSTSEQAVASAAGHARLVELRGWWAARLVGGELRGMHGTL